MRRTIRSGSTRTSTPLPVGLVTLVVVAGVSGCQDGRQERLIETYRAASFSPHRSSLEGRSLHLGASLELGDAYEITATRLEYAALAADSGPPVGEDGALVRPRVVNAEFHPADSAAGTGNGASRPAREAPRGGRLETRLPSSALDAGALYYRWVVEYSSGGDRLSMRKSPVFRTTRERIESARRDEALTRGDGEGSTSP